MRRSVSVRKFAVHIKAISEIVKSMFEAFMILNVSTLIIEVVRVIIDAVVSWLYCEEHNSTRLTHGLRKGGKYSKNNAY